MAIAQFLPLDDRWQDYLCLPPQFLRVFDRGGKFSLDITTIVNYQQSITGFSESQRLLARTAHAIRNSLVAFGI